MDATLALPVAASTHAAGLVSSPPARSSLTDAARRALDSKTSTIIERWLAALSPASVRAYRRALRAFGQWALADADAAPERALQLLVEGGCGPAHALVTDWRNHLLGTGLASGSVACFVTGVSSLLKACRRAGVIAWSLEQVMPKVERRHDRTGPRRGEVERLVEHVDALAEAGDPRAIRDAAIVRLLYSAAMRRGEVTALQLAHAQLEHADGPVVLSKRKGHRELQPVLISERTAQALRRWLAIRGTAPGPLFHRCDRARGEAGGITGDGIRRLLAARAIAAGIRSAVRPHGLRHASATAVAGIGSIATLMAIGGWKSLSAAQNYVDRLQTERRRALAMVEV